jgi:aryl-alcohol dehydrogenase-like predicted oxidoreductase
MKYRQFGKHGIKLSAVGIGSWLTYGMSIEDKTALSCIKTALERALFF